MGFLPVKAIDFFGLKDFLILIFHSSLMSRNKAKYVGSITVQTTLGSLGDRHHRRVLSGKSPRIFSD